MKERANVIGIDASMSYTVHRPLPRRAPVPGGRGAAHRARSSFEIGDVLPYFAGRVRTAPGPIDGAWGGV